MEMRSRIDIEIREAKARAGMLRHEAETHRLLHDAKTHALWRSALAAQLRRAAEHLEPQPDRRLL